MTPDSKIRLSRGLMAAALPALAAAQISFYAWAGAGPRVLQDSRWWLAATAVFVGLVVAAGFLVIDADAATAGQVQSGRRAPGSLTRIRVAWALLVAALLAYFFYRAASASWFFWLPIPMRFRFLIFQDWYWWVAGLVICFALVTAAIMVVARDELAADQRAPTPIEDDTHRLVLDEHGREIAPAATVREPELFPPRAQTETPRHEAAKRSKPAVPSEWRFGRWALRFAITTVIVLVLIGLRLTPEASYEALALLTFVASIIFAVWIFVRNR